MNFDLINNNEDLTSWLKKIETLNGPEKNIKLGLDIVRFFADKLNLKKPAKQVITVAGTNGKGTTVKLLETLYSKAGYNTASFTSPHLIKFNERVSINNINISDHEIILAFNQVYQVSQKYKNEYKLSYFEFVFLSSWYIYYNFYKLDLLILEVGLGGRLDATNIIDNDISIITSIDYDHQAYLGDTLEKIAFEKAGIIKSNSIVIIGRNIPDIVKNRAIEFNSEYKILEKDFPILAEANNYSGLNADNISLCYELALLNNERNLLVLKEEYLNNFFKNLSDNFQMPARAELVKTNKFDILFDVAHNPHSIKNLYKKLVYLKDKNKYHKIYAICGMLQDKGSKSSLNDINNIIDSWGVIDLSLVSPRGMKSKELSVFINSKDKKDFKTANDAHLFFENKITNKDLLVVFGSFHTVGQLYDKSF